MNLNDKLYNLYIKIIEKTEDRNQIDDRFGIDLKEDGITYHISMTSSIDSISNNKSIYSIKFQDLNADITKEQYDHIIELVKNKIRYFTLIEEEKEKKRQEVIVDRLLNKFKY